MIKTLHINTWKAVFCFIFLLGWIDVFSQCNLTITNPACSATTVNLTAPGITAGSANVGTLTYWSDPQATVPLANPAAVAASGFYYIKNTTASCTSINEVAVTIGTTAPTANTLLYVNCPLSSANSIFFDFNTVGQTSYNYTYQIGNGPIVSGTKTAPTSHIVSGVGVGVPVTFTVSFVGVCTPPRKTVGFVPGSNPDFPLATSYCIGTVLPTTAPNGITGTWSPATVTSGTHNYTFTGTPCSSIQVVSITGNPTVTPTFNPIGPFCQGSAAPALPANSTNGISGTWSPATISTATTGTQNYTFTANAGQCAAPSTVVAITVSNQVTPAFNAYPATLCQNAVAPALPASTNGITGTWNPATISTATPGTKTSTFVPNAGQCVSATPVSISVNVVQNTNPTFNPIAPICAGTPPPALPATSIEGFTGTWSPATISNTTSGTYTFTPSASQCATTATLNVTVTPAPTTTFNGFPGNSATFCSGFAAPALPTTSSNGVTGTWSPAVISNTASGQYTFTPNAGQCASNYVLNVTVTPTQPIQFTALPQVFSVCVGSPSIPLPSTSDNGITGTWTAAAVDTSTPGVKHYSFTANPGQCLTSQIYSINVDVTPKIIPLYGPIMPFCEGTAPPQGLALPTTVNTITGTWSPSASIDNTIVGHTVYMFTPTPGQCADPTTLNVVIIARDIPVFTLQQIPSFCSGTTPIPVLPTVSDNGITGTWNPSVIDNTLTTTYTFTPDAGLCAATATMTVVVDQPADPGFDNPIVFCEGTTPPVLQNISPSGVNGTWSPALIDPTANGATYTFTPDAGECANPQTVSVTIHPLTLQSVTWTATSFFSDDAVITVTATNPGNYYYQLDYGPLYTTNIFTGVAPGTHTITVYDVNGCGAPISLVDAVTIVDYPRFFTPNADTYNDTWNIFSLRDVGQEQASIFIFDRHGKLIKQIAPAGLGWDGTYNGQPLPSSDYWFVVKYAELGVPREFKAHFSLKR